MARSLSCDNSACEKVAPLDTAINWLELDTAGYGIGGFGHDTLKGKTYCSENCLRVHLNLRHVND